MGKATAMADLGPQEFIETVKVNALGPLILFQSVQYLLKKSNGIGKFVVITSAQGSIAGMVPGRSGAYGVTKAAVVLCR
jgi:NAD(P)-dependent dehydrogenase (short-subunit alcohol dehydrogenase family)